MSKLHPEATPRMLIDVDDLLSFRLCKAQKHRYKHLDMVDLEDKLGKSDARLKLIVTDGAFSMDGDIAPLRYSNLHNTYYTVIVCSCTLR